MTATTRPIGFWLKLVDGLISEQFAASLGRFDVTRLQWQILTVISGTPHTQDQIVTELQPFLEAGEPGVDYAIEGLLARGWLDADGLSFELTTTGREQTARLGALVRQTRELLGQGLTDDQYAATLATLEQMARNLGWSDDA